MTPATDPSPQPPLPPSLQVGPISCYNRPWCFIWWEHASLLRLQSHLAFHTDVAPHLPPSSSLSVGRLCSLFVKASTKCLTYSQKCLPKIPLSRPARVICLPQIFVMACFMDLSTLAGFSEGWRGWESDGHGLFLVLQDEKSCGKLWVRKVRNWHFKCTATMFMVLGSQEVTINKEGIHHKGIIPVFQEKSMNFKTF